MSLSRLRYFHEVIWLCTGLILLWCVGGCGTDASSLPNAPAAAFSTTVIAFPSTTVGSAANSASQLTNTGGQTLLLSGAIPSDTADFGTSTDCSSSLPAGASCTYTLQFTPQTAQALNATLTLRDNSGEPVQRNRSFPWTAQA